jgi:hypothetical protein
MEADLGIDYAADVTNEPLDNDKVFRAVGNFLAVAELLQIAQNSVERYKKEYRELAEDKLPELFMEQGIDSFTFTSAGGTDYTVDIKPVVSAKIKNKSMHDKALDWLSKNHFGHLIKNSITIFFDKHQDAEAEKHEVLANMHSLEYERRATVHATTLKTALRDYVLTGKSVDSDAFSVYCGRKAVIRGAEEVDNEES